MIIGGMMSNLHRSTTNIEKNTTFGRNRISDVTGTKHSICAYKWAWSTVFLSLGTTASCHRTEQNTISPQSFSFHNTKSKIQTRQSMLDGEWPTGCDYCRVIEKSGGISDRMDLNRDLDLDIIPPELYTNPLATQLTPTCLEMYFNRLCNQSCVYCSSVFSSKWAEEDKKYNGTILGVNHNLIPVSDDEYKKLYKAFWEWMNQNYTSLRRLNILGGEPFFQQELIDVLDFFDNNPAPNLFLTIFSNLKIDKNKFLRICDRLQNFIDNKKIRKLKIVASMDGLGPEMEYIRAGANMEQWEENFTILSNQYSFVMEVHGVITSLSIPSMERLLKFINFLNKNRPINNTIMSSFNLCIDPECFQPGIFSKGYFDNYFEKIMKQLQWKRAMKGYFDTINNSPENKKKQQILVLFLDELDKRRKTNWRETFPWLTIN
tara:strand:- start:799 stop:2094 length:1296 start_codon:yes stop_codon:yes gene_type:complete